jgi:hypothetical protein
VGDQEHLMPQTTQSPEIDLIKRTLQKRYANVDVYRYTRFSIRVRIIDPVFAGLSLSAREDLVLDLIHELPDELQQDIMLLLMLAPDELGTSAINVEFEHPNPSILADYEKAIADQL